MRRRAAAAANSTDMRAPPPGNTTLSFAIPSPIPVGIESITTSFVNPNDAVPLSGQRNRLWPSVWSFDHTLTPPQHPPWSRPRPPSARPAPTGSVHPVHASPAEAGVQSRQDARGAHVIGVRRAARGFLILAGPRLSPGTRRQVYASRSRPSRLIRQRRGSTSSGWSDRDRSSPD